MNDKVMQQLVAILNDNLGQKLTGALATGIAAMMNQVLLARTPLDEQVDHNSPPSNGTGD